MNKSYYFISMRKIKTWSDYWYVKKNNTGHPTLDQDRFLSEQLKTEHRQLALDEFVNNNMLVVHKLTKNYTWSNLEYDDLVQYGVEGLIAAAESYDANKGFKFSTLCYHYILGRLRRALEQFNNTIKIPAHLNMCKIRINHLDESKEYTDEFLSQFADERYTLIDIKHALEIKRLYKLDDIDDLVDIKDENIKDFEIKIAVDQILNELRPIDKICIEMKFGLNGHKTHYYKEIDKELNIDSEGIISRALLKLKNNSNLECFLDYLK